MRLRSLLWVLPSVLPVLWGMQARAELYTQYTDNDFVVLLARNAQGDRTGKLYRTTGGMEEELAVIGPAQSRHVLCDELKKGDTERFVLRIYNGGVMVDAFTNEVTLGWIGGTIVPGLTYPRQTNENLVVWEPDVPGDDDVFRLHPRLSVELGTGVTLVVKGNVSLHGNRTTVFVGPGSLRITGADIVRGVTLAEGHGPSDLSRFELQDTMLEGVYVSISQDYDPILENLTDSTNWTSTIQLTGVTNYSFDHFDLPSTDLYFSLRPTGDLTVRDSIVRNVYVRAATTGAVNRIAGTVMIRRNTITADEGYISVDNVHADGDVYIESNRTDGAIGRFALIDLQDVPSSPGGGGVRYVRNNTQVGRIRLGGDDARPAGCSGVRVVGNRVVGLYRNAILIHGHDNLISNNTVTSFGAMPSGAAVLIGPPIDAFGAARNNTVAGNYLQGYGAGIDLQSAIGNTITGNDVEYNRTNIVLTGVAGQATGATNPRDNLIYNNRFVGAHSVNFAARGTCTAGDCANTWCIWPKIAGPNILGGPYIAGNLWDDHPGPDTDGDGLADTPYRLYDENVDEHPIAAPAADLAVSVLTAPPSRIDAGETIRIECEIVNLGPDNLHDPSWLSIGLSAGDAQPHIHLVRASGNGDMITMNPPSEIGSQQNALEKGQTVRLSADIVINHPDTVGITVGAFANTALRDFQPANNSVDYSVTVAGGTVDSDGDGVPDALENRSIHDGDTNRDGVRDSEQNRVAALGSVSMAVDAVFGLVRVSRLAAGTLVALPIPERNTRSCTGGAVGTVTNVPPGGEVEVTMRVKQFRPGSVLAFVRALETNTTSWTQATNAVTESNTVRISFVDGGERDLDGAANGSIKLGTVIVRELPLDVTLDEKDADTGNSQCVGKGGDPINMGTGEFSFERTFLRPGGMLPLGFRLYYGSRTAGKRFRDGLPHMNFSHSHRVTLWRETEGRAVVELGRGRTVGFHRTVDGWEAFPMEALRWQMQETADYYYVLDPSRHRLLTFRKFSPETASLHAFLVRVEDRNGNALTYTNPDDVDAQGPTAVTDGIGRQLNFTYRQVGINDTRRYLTGVEDQAGRRITFTYEEDPGDNPGRVTLRSITNASGDVWTYSYDGSGHDLVADVEHPRGNSTFVQTYRTNTTLRGSVRTQTDAYSNTAQIAAEQFADDDPVTRFKYINADGTERVFEHDHYGRVLRSVTYEDGKRLDFNPDNTRDIVTRVTDSMGDSTAFDYHPETGRIAAVTNNEGHAVACTYTARDQTFVNPAAPTDTVTFTFYDLTRVDYPDGTHDALAYDARGNVTTHTDRAASAWSFEHNARGQVTRVINPTGGGTSYAYNDDGTLASATDSETGGVTNGYDVYKRLVSVTHTGGTCRIDYDLNDRVTAVTDERGETWNYDYDANGNLLRATDPAGNAASYVYDLMDRVRAYTNRLGKTTRYAYDERGRLASVTDPNGSTTRFAYDPRGRLVGITDPADKPWPIGRDDEGVVTSATTPLQRTTAFGRNRLGDLAAVTNPLGHTVFCVRDEMSRIGAVTDPLQRTTRYGYDDRGLLAGVTLPDARSATYEYNDAGLLAAIRDLGGNAWRFTYTDAGRLRNLTDPLSNTWNCVYNTRGFPARVTYPTGETLTLTYDASGRLTRRQYSAGPDLHYTYDDVGRLLTAAGVRFAHDAAGRIVATEDTDGHSFGAAYDDGGRLESVTYADQLFTVTYTWNARDLLTGVSDNLTGSGVRFTYDDDGRLTRMTRTNGVNASWTRDDASRLTHLREGTSADLRYTYNAAGEVIRGHLVLPLPTSNRLTSRLERLTYNAASQIDTAGHRYDARGRLIAAPGHTYAWDGASRLIDIDGVALTYNGMGDLRTRTEGGVTTRYYYNYALGLYPVVAEKDASSGQWQRFYVLAHNGMLLYAIDVAHGNRVSFYHYDKGGNTLFLSDAGGNITDRYAYTPYGRLLRHEGTNTQCFTFGGAYQARCETDDLYQMRARYYDARSACFISREPLWPRIATPQALNPYQYARRNPAMFVDRTGELELFDDSWRWSNAGKNWVKEVPKNDPPSGRHSHSAIVSGDKMYTFFGVTTTGLGTDIHSYDFTTKEWKLVTTEGRRQAQRTAVFVDRTERIELFDDTWKWISAGKDWVRIVPENRMRGEPRAAQGTAGVASQAQRTESIGDTSGARPFVLQLARPRRANPMLPVTPRVEVHVGQRQGPAKAADMVLNQVGVLGKGRMSFCLMQFKRATDAEDAELKWEEPEPDLKLWGRAFTD